MFARYGSVPLQQTKRLMHLFRDSFGYRLLASATQKRKNASCGGAEVNIPLTVQVYRRAYVKNRAGLVSSAL